MAGSMRGDSVEEFKGLRITSLDDEEEEEQDIDIDEEDEDEGETDYTVLGFVKKPKNPHSLLRHFFPSKAGGVPAWLDPVNLPLGRSFLCDICGEPLQFMLQVYAPEDVEYAFHRTLFVFICTSMVCLRIDQHEQWKRHPDKPSRSVKVFRCQLPRDNPFYSSEPPKKDDKPPGSEVSSCTWCGTWRGIKQCSSCKIALYCSEKHKVKHSQLGHDYDCQRVRFASESIDSSLSNSGTISSELQKVACTTLWPELEVIQEDEDEFDTRMSDDNGGVSTLVSGNRTDDTIMSLMKEFEGDDERKSWLSFEERIAWAPEQVLRYCKTPDAKPLWPMSSGRPSKDGIPKCSHCSGPLRFEFQILPQLLYYFHVRNDKDSLDWATIAVYTCEASCDSSVAYKEEYAWVQLS
ncbi:uncharacterized protein LOC133789415 isoform X2 [Humulus lupulus]|uniref:uncharacterized protein LOC133789415 isoform X2 n=1 Tax=Humulus lupulus TaxID=3486 RepID=UPI002B4184D7|nr:uncharacterized protein LOC133789415 isoform X2 [Humulus lupulus]